jgi:serine/threonine-protein kinase
VDELKRALDLEPINADAYRELGRTYEAQNKLGEAENTYRRAVQLRPADWSCAFALGAFYYRHGRNAEAASEFQKVIDLTPDNFNGYLNLGGLYIATGRYQDAERLLKKAVELNPTYQTYSNLGTVYYQLGRYAEAVTMYEKAAQSSSDYILIGNLADSYRWAPGFAGKAPATYARAIEMAEQQLAINPKNATALSSVAAYRAKLGEPEKGLADIRRAIQLAPQDTTVAAQALLVYEIAGLRSRALETLEELLKRGYSITQVETEPELKMLREDPAYATLASRYAKR